MLRPSCAGSGGLPQSKQDSKYDSPEMESSLVCLRTRKPAWVGGRSRKDGGTAELSVSSWVTDGIMGYGKDYGFYSKSSLWVLRSWEVVCFKNTALSGEQPGSKDSSHEAIKRC